MSRFRVILVNSMEVDIEAYEFEIGVSVSGTVIPALIFHSDSGKTVAAFAPGEWAAVRAPASIPSDKEAK
jgi:hypothetical protein